MENNLLLEAVNIHKSYHNTEANVEVLKGLDIKIDSGEMVAIIGPSGAGKSTLLHVLGSLDKPDKGIVTIDGEDIYRLKDHERSELRNKKIGFIFQFYHLLPEFSALENVILPMLVKEKKGNIKKYKKFGEDLLEQVGLKNRMKHKPHQMSGGEQQRVAIARALINQPKIVFCDEPTGNLDSESGDSIVRILTELNQKQNQTIIMVTHDENIARLCHRIIRVKDGNLLSVN